jgi:hypothetical protein
MDGREHDLSLRKRAVSIRDGEWGQGSAHRTSWREAGLLIGSSAGNASLPLSQAVAAHDLLFSLFSTTTVPD